MGQLSKQEILEQLRSLSPDEINEILGELGYRYPLVFGSVTIKDSVVAAVSVVDSSQVGAVLRAIANRVSKDCAD